MRIKFILYFLLTFVLFSCKSTPPYNPLDWNRSKFKPKDGKLFVAIKYGTNNDVITALKNAPDINVADYLEQTAFMWACRNGNLDIINELLNYNKENIDKKTRNYKKLDINAKSSPKTPELQYNALFCYIMSNSINPEDQNAKDTLIKIIDLDKAIIDMTDWYGETVIHKMIRSNKNYFEIITKGMDEQKKKEIINKKSIKYQQSPLMLAIELGNSQMIDALVKDGISDDITNIDLPIKAFNQGNGNLEVFLSIYKGKLIHDNKHSQPRIKNDQLDKEISDLLLRPLNVSFRNKIFYFLHIINAYRDEMIIKPDDLEPEEYKKEKKRIFNMLQRRMNFTEKNNFYEIIKFFPSAIKEMDEEDTMKRTLLQLVIEKQDFDVFEWIMKNIPLENNIKPTGNGAGDYLTVAMLKRNKRVMDFLLSDQNLRYNIENLMTTYTRISQEFAIDTFGKNEQNPLILFCTDDKLSNDRNLLVKLADFYKPNYSQPEYCFKLLEELEKINFFTIYEYFLDNYGQYFYDVDTLNGNPVLGVLLDKEQKGLAQKYIMKKKDKLDNANVNALYTRKNKYLDLWELYEKMKIPPEPPASIQKVSNQQSKTNNKD